MLEVWHSECKSIANSSEINRYNLFLQSIVTTVRQSLQYIMTIIIITSDLKVVKTHLTVNHAQGARFKPHKSQPNITCSIHYPCVINFQCGLLCLHLHIVCLFVSCYT